MTPTQAEATKLIRDLPREVLLALVYKLTAGSVNPIAIDRIIEAEKLSAAHRPHSTSAYDAVMRDRGHPKPR